MEEGKMQPFTGNWWGHFFASGIPIVLGFIGLVIAGISIAANRDGTNDRAGCVTGLTFIAVAIGIALILHNLHYAW